MRRKSYVGKKENKKWVWLALDIKNREIVGVYIGDYPTETLRERSKEAAKGLCKSLPLVYRQCAVCYTDFWESYNGVFSKKDIERWIKVVAKRAILNALITLYDNESRAWSETLCLFLKVWITI